MAKLLSGTRIYGTATVDTTLFVSGTDDASSATTGAVQVVGGVGVGGTLYVEGGTIFADDLAVNGGDLTTTALTFNLINTNATTVNFAGAGTTVNIGYSSGNTYVRNSLNVDINSTLGLNTDSLNTVNGKLTVNLKDNTADIFTVRESTNNYIKINTNNSLEKVTFGVLPTYEFLNETDATSTSVASTTFAGGVGIAKKLFVGTDLDVDGNATIGDNRAVDAHTVTGSLVVNVPDNTAIAFQVKENTQTYITAVTTNGSESVTFEATPKVLIKNVTDSTDKDTGALIVEGGTGIEKNLNVGVNLGVVGDTTLTGDLAVNGGDITTTATTFNLINTTATTVNFAGAATTLEIGAATGTTNINNDLDVDGDVNVDGGDITTSATTFNLINTTATTGNLFGAATTINVGAAGSSGVITVKNDNVVLDGDLEVKGGDLTTNQTTFNLLNTTATTVNAFGAATTIDIGASTGTLTINNTQVIFNSTDSIQLPVGNVAQRDLTPVPGQIRYNSELSSFEGYGPGNNWGSLGGVKDVDGNTYIIPETAPAANENILYFYNDGTQTLTLAETLFDLKVGVDAVINSTTASTTKTSGALQVVGGVGIGGTVNANELTLTTDLEVQYGGSGRSTFTENGVLYGNNADGLLVTAESNPGSNAITSYGILTTDINNVPVWTDVIDGGSY